MADKYTITLWPPEHGAEPHIPIEVHPSQVAEMKAIGWRDKDPNPSAAEKKPAFEDPPGVPATIPRGKKKKKENAKDAEISDSDSTAR